MEKEILSAVLGDMRVIYSLDGETSLAGLCILPDTDIEFCEKRVKIHSLAEAKIVGDNYSGSYFGGESMNYSDTTLSLKYNRQEIEETEREKRIITYLKSDRGIEIKHTLTHRNGRKYVTIRTELINNSDSDIKLEMLSSFALYNISPYLEGAGENSMLLHRMRSKWSQEGRLISENLEDLQL